MPQLAIESGDMNDQILSIENTKRYLTGCLSGGVL
jgi:hypothetical protein